MKHSKHIARIVTFALLAVTMIGTLAGCKNAAGGYDGPYLTGLYADARIQRRRLINFALFW